MEGKTEDDFSITLSKPRRTQGCGYVKDWIRGGITSTTLGG
jgi:hypothetical protein